MKPFSPIETPNPASRRVWRKNSKLVLDRRLQFDGGGGSRWQRFSRLPNACIWIVGRFVRRFFGRKRLRWRFRDR
jgi:hypothetical protein